MDKETFNSLRIEEQINTVNTLLAQGETLMAIFVHKKLIDANESTVRTRFVKAGYKLNKITNQYFKTEGTREILQEYPNKNEYLQSTLNNKKEESPSSTLKVVPKDLPKDTIATLLEELEKKNLKKSSPSASTTIKDQYPDSTPKVIYSETSESTTAVVPKEIEQIDEYSQSTLAIVPPEKVQKLIKLVDAQPALEEILEWWKKEKQQHNIIDVPSISFDKNKLQGEITSKTFKTFKGVIDDFISFCTTYPEYMQRDLVAMALVEYMNRYKK